MTVAERTAEIARTTAETEIRLRIDVDGSGRSKIDTGVGFLDHMLDLFAKHGGFDLEVSCKGDLRVDAHHSTEDVGIALGSAIDRALGDRAGIKRYGQMLLPMDESLVLCAIDLGGRPFFAFDAEMPSPKIGEFDSELVAEFWRAVATNARMNLHIKKLDGKNTHHVAEAIFKAAARSLRTAVEVDPRVVGVPSTKGTI